VREVSKFNEALYRTFVSPWVQAATNPWVAESLKWLHPMRTSRYLFSEAFNPWMRGAAVLADAVAKNWNPLPQDHPLLDKEREIIGRISQSIETVRELRDTGSELAFTLLYGAGANGTCAQGAGRHDNRASKEHGNQ
jgi:hypothetical protein